MHLKTWLTILLSGAVSFTAGAQTGNDTGPDPSHPEIQGALSVIDAWLDAQRDYQQIPGMSAGIVLDQELIWSAGYGFANLADQIPADENTIYSICSISKLFTSLAVMQMRDAGKLKLSDPIADHLDWYDLEQVHDGGPVTVEGVLTHSSGLPREGDFFYWNAPEFPYPTREELIAELDRHQTLYPASTWFQYSNLGLSLAGELVAATSGIPFEDYVQQKLLGPLDMNDTRPRYPEELRGKQMAVGYSGLERDLQRKEVPAFFTRAITPAAGFTSTVNDLARFASWHFRLLKNGGSEVLDSNTLREMQRVHWTSPDWQTTWGIGYNVRKAPDGNHALVGHSGGCPGYVTMFVMSPKHKLGAIVLTNASDTYAGRMAVSSLALMVGALAKAGSAIDGELPDFSVYEGNYNHEPWGGETAIRRWGDKLAAISLPADNLNSAVQILKQKEGHHFVRVTDEGEEREPWVFEFGDGENAESIRRHSYRMHRN